MVMQNMRYILQVLINSQHVNNRLANTQQVNSENLVQDTKLLPTFLCLSEPK